MEIKNLKPQAVWSRFYELTQIPRPSKHEEEVITFMYNFGKTLGLETHRDTTGNILIRKPATPGMENRKVVVLQSHMDMVPQANSGVKHDFMKDPIDAYVDGDWVTARNTTLGADNGIGAAAAMAVLAATDLKHGPIEALFTTDEETGMTGAFGLKPDFLKADILLNLDSEDEGELYVGCAGGVDANIKFAYNQEDLIEEDVAVRIAIKGLKGGHSGLDINSGRANANKLLCRFLKHAIEVHEVRLASIEGGNMRNAIPREAVAVVTLPLEGIADLTQDLAEFEEIYKNEYQYTEPNIEMEVVKVALPKGVFPEMVQDDIINSVVACPNGVYRMDFGMPGVVETSSSMGIIKSNDEEVTINILIRSSVESAKQDLCSSIESLFNVSGAAIEFTGGYPGWKPNMNSEILKTMKMVYEKQWGRTPEIKAIHAGLECGLIGATYPKMEMISFGPTIRHPHSPDEKVNIGTVDLFWEYLKLTLEQIPAKN